MLEPSVVERFESKTHRIDIELDDCAESPREWNDVSTIYHVHSRDDLGERVDEIDAEFLEREFDGGVWLPLYLFDHSGISVSTEPFSCRWDSGQVGVIGMTQEVMDKEFGGDVEKAKSWLVGEVETFDSFLKGEVYYYCVYEKVGCECCGNVEMERKDSCAGFYGIDHLKEDLKSQGFDVADSSIWTEKT